MGSTGGDCSLDLLPLQQRAILLHLHSGGNSPDLRVCPHRPENTQKSFGGRTLPVDLHLLHSSVCPPLHPLLLLQGNTPPTQGYLPNDQTGNLIFKIQEFIATALSAYVLYTILVLFKGSYNSDLDTVKCYYLIGLAGVLAFFFHSTLNRSFIGDYTWAFTQYLETFAILSQFVLFRNKVG